MKDELQFNIDEYVSKDKWKIKTHILNERWNEVDNNMSTFYSKNQKINRRMYDNLQSIFEWIKFDYSELNNYANMSDISRLRTRIEELKDEYGLEGYIGYELTNYSRRKKLRNKDLLLALLMVEYYRQYKEQNKAEDILFDQIKNVEYRKVSIETAKVLNKKIPKEPIEMPEVDWLGILLGIGANGFKWRDYKEGNLNYNTRKLYELIIIHIQQGKETNINDDDIKKLLGKQERAYINRTKKDKVYEDYKNDFSGSLDNQVAFLVNQVALKGMKNQGCKKVQFIAVEDEKTTKMCSGLDGQIFEIDGINRYYRYSAEDGKDVLYTTKGLETGANLPPINNHYHNCRSTIYPVR